MSENPTQINPVCQQMLNCRLTGNITPISWFRNIMTGSGKPDVVAIILLVGYRLLVHADDDAG